MERRLGPIERTLFDIDRIYPLNFTSVGRVSGPLTEARVQAALTAAVARHPHLTHRIVVGAGHEVWLREGGKPPSLRFVIGGDWVAEADAEVNTVLARETGPLVQCVVVEHSPLDHTLLLTFHHCIGDGFSGAYLMRDLVQAAAAVVPGAPPPSLVPFDDLPSLDDLIPDSARGVNGLWAQLTFAFRMLGTFLRYGPAHAIRDDASLLAHQRRARVIPFVFDVDVASRLAARARTEGTTVHGALSAALILTMCNEGGATQPTRIGFGSPVNLRKVLSPPVGEQLGLFVSMAAWEDMVAPDRDLWDLARDIRRCIVRDQEENLPLASLSAMVAVGGLIGAQRVETEVFAERMEKHLRSTGGLTNLGKLDLETHFGDLTLEDLHFLTSPSAMGAWVTTATSINGKLFWNFTFAEPAILEPRARTLAAEAVKRLQAAI